MEIELKTPLQKMTRAEGKNPGMPSPGFVKPRSRCAVLPVNTAKGSKIDLIVGGIHYIGSFAKVQGPLLLIQDPFENTFVVPRFVQAVTISPASWRKSDKTGKLRLERKSTCAVHALRCLLQGLLKTPVVVQFGNTIVNGLVADVTRDSLFLTQGIRSASTAGSVPMKIMLNFLSAVIVPVINTPGALPGNASAAAPPPFPVPRPAPIP
jgi:hypothetical protein